MSCDQDRLLWEDKTSSARIIMSWSPFVVTGGITIFTIG